MKIVVLDGYTENPGDLSWEGFMQLGELTVYDRTAYDLSGKDLIIRRAREAHAVIVNKTPLNAEIIDALSPQLKYIGVLATGYNIVDVAHAAKKDVTVCNIPTYGTASVAQMTIALLLEICNHVWAHSESVRRGDWSNSPDWCYWNYPLIELSGKTIGIIGFGRIGWNVAQIAVALGMDVLAYDEIVRPELETDHIRYTPLDELYAKSDVISLHCPLFPSTSGMINHDSIVKMKDGVFIINTSRGPLIHEQALADALNSGKIGGAALDVVSSEPISANNPLLTAKNCILTPHISWAPKESRQRLMNIAVENLKAFMNGAPQNVIKAGT